MSPIFVSCCFLSLLRFLNLKEKLNGNIHTRKISRLDVELTRCLDKAPLPSAMCASCVGHSRVEDPCGALALGSPPPHNGFDPQLLASSHLRRHLTALRQIVLHRLQSSAQLAPAANWQRRRKRFEGGRQNKSSSANRNSRLGAARLNNIKLRCDQVFFTSTTFSWIKADIATLHWQQRLTSSLKLCRE